MWNKKLKLPISIHLAVIIMLIGISISQVVNFRSHRESAKSQEELKIRHMPFLELTQSILLETKALQALVLETILSESQKDLDLCIRKGQLISDYLRSFRKMGLNAAPLPRFRKSFDTYLNKALDLVTKIVTRGEFLSSQTTDIMEIEALFITFRDNLNFSRLERYDFIAKGIDESLEQSTFSLWLNVIILLAGVLVLCANLFYQHIFLVKPIFDLRLACQKIWEGQYQHKVVVNTQDELGDLSWRFNTMAAKVGQKITHMEYTNHTLTTLSLIKTLEELGEKLHEIMKHFLGKSVDIYLKDFPKSGTPEGEVFKRLRADGQLEDLKKIVDYTNNSDRLIKIFDPHDSHILAIIDLATLEDQAIHQKKPILYDIARHLAPVLTRLQYHYIVMNLKGHSFNLRRNFLGGLHKELLDILEKAADKGLLGSTSQSGVDFRSLVLDFILTHAMTSQEGILNDFKSVSAKLANKWDLPSPVISNNFQGHFLFTPHLASTLADALTLLCKHTLQNDFIGTIHKISLSTKVAQNRLVLVYKDNGVGIDVSQYPQSFLADASLSNQDCTETVLQNSFNDGIKDEENGLKEVSKAIKKIGGTFEIQFVNFKKSVNHRPIMVTISLPKSEVFEEDFNSLDPSEEKKAS